MKKKKEECPYDDWACRVYGFCGTKKCDKRRKLLKNKNENGKPYETKIITV